MKIGVMSDTHGHLDAMKKAVARMINEHHVDMLIHLGDDSSDVEALSSIPVEIIWVPGIYENRYKDKSIPNRLIKEIEDVPFLLSHTPTKDPHDLENDIDPTEAICDGDVKVMLHGHSHKWKIGEERGVIIINPGHLRTNDERGGEPTFAILDVSSSKLDAKILGLKGDVLAEKTFFIGS